MKTDATIHVLLVEDDLVDVERVRLVFAGLGLKHELTVLQNASEAIAFLNRDAPYYDAVQPELVLMGLRASHTDGAAILQEIARLRSSGRQTITVMALVKSDDSKSLKAAQVLGADTYFVKPTRSEELRSFASKLRQLWSSLSGVPSGLTPPHSPGSESSR